MTINKFNPEVYDNTRVLVTGGAGAIGTNLCRRLTELGALVTVLDDFSSASLDGERLAKLPGCNLIRGSILDATKLERAFSFKPSHVFHLAALFANQNSVDHPEEDLMVNGLGTLRVLQAAKAVRAQRLVYAA